MTQATKTRFWMDVRATGWTCDAERKPIEYGTSGGRYDADEDDEYERGNPTEAVYGCPAGAAIIGYRRDDETGRLTAVLFER